MNRLTCSCGYQTTLRMGTGRELPDKESIERRFSEDKLREFHEALQSKTLGKLFYIENVMSYCEHCDEIREGGLLHYQVNRKEKTSYDCCPVCGHGLEQIKMNPLCPKCGKPLSVEMSGLWD